MERIFVVSVLMLTSIYVIFNGSAMPKETAASQTTSQLHNWNLTYGRYDTSRAGSNDLPLRVLSVPGGKLGPAEKFRIFVSRLNNNSNKAIIAARFTWLLFDARDLNKTVQKSQTELVNLNIEAQTEVSVNIDIVNLEDIPLLREKNPSGTFHLEVAATEVHYNDGSVWVAKDVPGRIRSDQSVP
jgi:hypothetical protein